ncbi:MAG: S8 family serine peptidase [Gammaproteobacteria bacterium]|nr:S8 family serine peptidase [Gammaproteobacteria bacterium]
MKGKIIPFFFFFFSFIDTSYAQALLKQAGNISDQYLVYFTNSIDITGRIRKEKSKAFDFLRSKQQENIDRLKFELADTDLEIKRSLWVNQSAAITISIQYIDRLNSLSFVSHVRTDKKYKVDMLGTSTLSLPSDELVQNNLFDIGVESIWNTGFRGQGVVVAIMDSGVDIEHATLKSRWRGGSNSWFDPVNGSDEPTDFSGHGTAVASIVLGGNENKTGAYLGVAPNAQWIAAKIFSNTLNGATASSSISTIQEALQWVLDPDEDSTTDDYPDIVQNSWGMANTEGSCTNTDFNDSLDAINALGIDIVFAVGNSGSTAGSRLAPSYHKDVISVGAVDTFNSSVETILSSSSRGPNLCEDKVLPSLMAPGVDIVAAEKSLGSVSAIRNTGENTGTSFSSPHVSGALALLRSQFDSSVDHYKFRNALFDSAKDLGKSGDDTDFGNGLVKVDGAMNLMLNDNIDRMPSEVTFSSAKYVFKEDESSIEISLLRTGDISTEQAVTIISENDTALNGSDFISVSTMVEFLAGESQKLIGIELVNDDVRENKESFNLIITSNNLKKKITIIDNDKNIEEEEDVIGGSSTGILQLFLLVLLWFGRRFLK